MRTGTARRGGSGRRGRWSAAGWLAAASLLGSAATAQIEAPALEPNLGWLNTDRPLRLDDELRGHVVLLDFWTYCCINCMHVLPDLEHLETKYEDEPFLVIGVHSAKFTNEATRESIRQAIERYDIRHPVVIDDGFQIWRRYGVRAWPTFVLIDAEGTVIGQTAGEGVRDVLDREIGLALSRARRDGALASRRVRFDPGEAVESVSGLRFPGKVEATPPTADDPGRLFIADSSNDRIVVTTWPDAMGRTRVVDVYGGGRGFRDGAIDDARFHDPQGMAYDAAAGALYVADTNNHAIRRIDLTKRRVTTVTGNGVISRDRRGGRSGRAQGLNSPWDVELSADGSSLYVAMAGSHQLWTVDLETGLARRLAGSGREALLDGDAASCALAQPSGLELSQDGETLYFADSEVSALRALDLNAGRVSTLIGEGLFDYGDIDGPFDQARLQHVLGVARLPDGEALLIADTYNHKIKRVDLESRTVATWLPREGEGLSLDEPGGLTVVAGPRGEAGWLLVPDTNHHRVVMVDVATRAWREVAIEGLDEGGAGATEVDAVETTIAARPGRTLRLRLDGAPGRGRMINDEAPVSVRVAVLDDGGGVGEIASQRTLRTTQFPIDVEIPGAIVRVGARLRVDLAWASCDGDKSECRPEEAAWLVTIRSGESSDAMLVADRPPAERKP